MYLAMIADFGTECKTLVNRFFQAVGALEKCVLGTAFRDNVNLIPWGMVHTDQVSRV